MPVVSVVIPVFRAEATVAEAVRSVLLQTLTDLELIVVDDGSPDASAAVAVAAAAEDSRFRLIRLPQNRGVSGARNAGFAAAVGTWIAPLDADDHMAPERLAVLVAAADSAGCDVIVDDLLVPLEDGSVVRAFGAERMADGERIAAARYASYDRPYAGLSTIGFAKPFFRRAFLVRSGVRYREHVYAGEDFDLVMQALLRGADLRFADYAGYTYRRDRSTLSRERQERVRAAMLASSRELVVEARERGDADAHAALELREREMMRWFDFDAFDGALRRGAFGTAFVIFRRSDVKRYFLFRLAARLRYDLYLRLGISLERKRLEALTRSKT